MSDFGLILPFDDQPTYLRKKLSEHSEPTYTYLILDYQIVEAYKDYIGDNQNLDLYRSLKFYLDNQPYNYLIKTIDLNDCELQIIAVKQQFSDLNSLVKSINDLILEIFMIQIERPLQTASNEPEEPIVEDKISEESIKPKFEALPSTFNHNHSNHPNQINKSYLFYEIDRNLIDELIKHTSKTMMLFLNENMKVLKRELNNGQKLLNQLIDLPIKVQKCKSRSKLKSNIILLNSDLRKKMIAYLALIRYYFDLWTTFDLLEKQLAIVTMNEHQMANIELMRLVPRNKKLEKKLTFSEEVKIIEFVRSPNEPLPGAWPIKTALDAFREAYYEDKD